jgi:hypothetical protein
MENQNPIPVPVLSLFEKAFQRNPYVGMILFLILALGALSWALWDTNKRLIDAQGEKLNILREQIEITARVQTMTKELEQTHRELEFFKNQKSKKR